MALSREQICQSTSKKLMTALPAIGSISAIIGLDGFVDEIIAVVDKRHDAERYDAIKTIDVFGQKVLRAVGQSSNFELLVKQTKLGGNGPIMANALAAAGMKITYIGNLGFPSLHPVFNEFARIAEVISIAEPGHTEALEFSDGKLMLGKHQSLGEVNWANLIARVGAEQLKKLTSQAKLVGLVNWTMLPHLSDIWEKFLAEILPGIARTDRKFFVDLCDPEKRTKEDIIGALNILSRVQEKMDVILGLNLKESQEVADVLEIPGGGNEATIETLAAAIRQKLNLSCVVIHPRRGAAAATATETARFAGPFVQSPKISTGAGDHFNAGFCLGRVLGFDLAESLCTGVAVSGYYVRTAESPSGKALSDFIAKLPAPQG
jgi:sugar/nucleoside kinase (ribokinase family)